nr:polyprotein [Hepelivirales sp.]
MPECSRSITANEHNAANACVASHIAERRRNQLRNRRILRYRIPEDLISHFDAYVPETYWDNGEYDNPHAFMAELREIANDKIRAAVRGRRVYSFGGRPEVDLITREGRRELGYSCVHICSLHSPKDTVRYRRAAAILERRKFCDPRLAESLRQAAAGAREFECTTWMCFKGGENCDIRIKDVDTAIAFDATYDVEPLDFVRYLQRKNIVEAYVSMIQPDNLFIDAKVVAPGVTWVWREQNGEIFIEQTFSGNNSGEKYIHRRSTWCAWFTQGTVKTFNGTYDFKIIDRVGPYAIFQIVLQPVDVFLEATTLIDFNGSVAIPRAEEVAKVLVAAKYKGCTEDLAPTLAEVGMYLVPARVYKDFINWLTAQETVDTKRALNYWRSISRGLMFGKTQVMEKFDAGLPDKVYASVLLSAMTMRWRLNETVSVVVDDMRQRQHYGLFVEKQDYARVRTRAKYRPGGRSWFAWQWDTVRNLWDHVMHTLGLFGLFGNIKDEMQRMTANQIGGLFCTSIEAIEVPLRHEVLTEAFPRLKAKPVSWHSSQASETPVSESLECLEMRESCYVESLRRQANERDDHLTELMRRTYAAIEPHLSDPVCTTPTLRIGPAGAGKTSEILKEATGVCLFIAASKELANDITTRAEKQQGSKWKVVTQHNGLIELATNTYDLVVLDEVYTYHAGYVLLLTRLARSARVILLGDPNQCGYYDEDEPATFDGFEAIANRYQTLATSVSHRIPQEIAAIVNRIPGVSILSDNPKTGIVSVVAYENAKQLKELKVDAVLVFSRENKRHLLAQLKSSTLPVYTVREAQGLTFDDIAIFVDMMPRSTAMQKMYYVAYTRATNRIITVVNRSENSTLLNLGLCGLDDAFSAFYGFVPYENSQHEDKELKLMTLREDYTEIITVWTERDLCSAMTAALGPVPDMNPRAMAVVPNQIIWDASKMFKLSAAGVVPVDVSFSGYTYDGPKWTKAMWGKSTLQTLDTIVQRQGAHVGTPPTDAASAIDAIVADIANAFVTRYIKRDESGEPAFAPIEEEHLSRELSNYLQRCDEVGNIELIEGFDITDPSHAVVDATMKRITKIVAGGPSSTKAGQVISAWSKPLTALIAPITRAIERCLVDSLNEHTHYANAMPEADLGEIYQLACQNNGELQGLNMDFSQFDASQSEVTIAIEKAILTRMGARPALLELYYALRSKWSALCHGICKVDAESMKSSGEPGTLLFNTILNMAYCAYITSVHGPVFMAFKGDDSCIVARGVDLVTLRAQILEGTTRVTVKHEWGKDNINHFCGAFLTPRGILPDLVRSAAKIRGLVFRDDEHFREYQRAIDDRLRLARGVSTGYALLVHDQYYRISAQTGTAVVQDVFGFVNEFPSLSWGAFRLLCRYSDARYGGADIIVADCRSETPLLAPYDSAHIKELFWRERNDEAICHCGAGARELDMPCPTALRRTCLVCGVNGQRCHLCNKCIRTYHRRDERGCSRKDCERNAVFAGQEVLCFQHFRRRYKWEREKPSNTYSVSSRSTSSVVKEETPDPPAPPKTQHHTYKVVREDIRAPKRMSVEPPPPSGSCSGSAVSVVSLKNQVALVRATNYLDCGIVCVEGQVPDHVAKNVRARVSQRRLDRAIKTGKVESPYVADDDIWFSLAEDGYGYLSAVQDDDEPDTAVIEEFSDGKSGVVRFDFVPGPETKDEQALRLQYKARKDDIMCKIDLARNAGCSLDLLYAELKRLDNGIGEQVKRNMLGRRARGHWLPKPKFKLKDPHGFMPQKSPHWGALTKLS